MGALLDLLPCCTHSIMRQLTGLCERRFALCIPLLQLLIAQLKDLGLGETKLFFVGSSLCFSCGDGAMRLLDGSRGAGTSLRQHTIQRTADKKPVSRYQQDKQDHRRHRAEHKSTELIQYLIHEWGRPKPLGSPVVSCLSHR